MTELIRRRRGMMGASVMDYGAQLFLGTTRRTATYHATITETSDGVRMVSKSVGWNSRFWPIGDSKLFLTYGQARGRTLTVIQSIDYINWPEGSQLVLAPALVTTTTGDAGDSGRKQAAIIYLDAQKNVTHWVLDETFFWSGFNGGGFSDTYFVSYALFLHAPKGADVIIKRLDFYIK